MLSVKDIQMDRENADIFPQLEGGWKVFPWCLEWKIHAFTQPRHANGGFRALNTGFSDGSFALLFKDIGKFFILHLSFIAFL